MYGPRANEGLLPNLGLQPGDRVVRVTGHDKWSDPDIGSEYTFCINSDYRKGVPHLVKAGSGWTTMNEKGTFRVIGRKPHDRAALDRLLAEAEAKSSANALRRVVDLPHRIEKLGGQNYAYVRVEEILNMIPKEAHDE